MLVAIRPNSISFFSFLSVNKNYVGLESVDTLTNYNNIFKYKSYFDLSYYSALVHVEHPS